MRFRICAVVALVAVMAFMAAPELSRSVDAQAAEQGQMTAEATDQTDVEPQAGFFAFAGGPVRAKLARTNTSVAALTEGLWRQVPGAVLTRTVPAGTSDLFNIAFSAECQVRSLGANDTARIRIAHFINGVQVAPVEPYDGDQRFCSAVNPLATHKGNWVVRAGAGVHVVRVEIMPVDFAPDNGVIVATIDDWTFELVVYD
jgi:hypothetical protein